MMRDFCLGCGRTPYEIKKWKTASDEYKQKVLDRLKVLYENQSKESY